MDHDEVALALEDLRQRAEGEEPRLIEVDPDRVAAPLDRRGAEEWLLPDPQLLRELDGVGRVEKPFSCGDMERLPADLISHGNVSSSLDDEPGGVLELPPEGDVERGLHLGRPAFRRGSALEER